MKDKINHREALARILRMVTGEEPGQVALDILIKAGARAYFVEVPACDCRSSNPGFCQYTGDCDCCSCPCHKGPEDSR